MNGYNMMAETYKKVLNEQVANGEDATETKRFIKVFDFLGTCTDEEICNLFDTSAFNEIMMSYVRLALKRCEVDDEIARMIRNEVSALLSEKRANEVLDL